jgi:hypothetical protein
MATREKVTVELSSLLTFTIQSQQGTETYSVTNLIEKLPTNGLKVRDIPRIIRKYKAASR